MCEQIIISQLASHPHPVLPYKNALVHILRAELQGLHQATCHVHDGTRFGQF